MTVGETAGNSLGVRFPNLELDLHGIWFVGVGCVPALVPREFVVLECIAPGIWFRRRGSDE